MATVQLAHNAVVAKLIDPSREVAAFATSLLSYQVDAGLGGSWSGKSSFYDVITNTFPAGFVHLMQAELTRIGHTVNRICRPHASPLGPENPIVDEFGNDDPDYDYQMKALRQVEKHGAGIIRVATGGGKSKIAKLIMARYRRMTLFLTTRGILLYQMDDQLKAIGLNTGQIGDGEMRVVRGVNLGMVQTLVQALQVPDLGVERRAIVKSIHLSKNKNADMSNEEITRLAQEAFDRKTRRRNEVLQILSLIEVVIGEEAHEAGGDSYYEILRHCKNATIRVALTATPFMRDSAADNMRLMAAFGPILINIPEELLIQRGILAKPIFKFADVPAPEKLRKTSPFERAYELGYVENPHMHAQAVTDAKMAAIYRLPVLTLIARKKHGTNLLKLYKDAGLTYEFLKGEDDQDARRTQLKRLAAGKLDGVIGTTILDVGVDVPAIALVQLIGGMKAEVQLRQRIGRGLRRKKRGPNVTFIADYSCNLNTYLRDHARQRENIVRNTPGFVEGILPAGQDFDWSIFAANRGAAEGIAA
ncbi:DEAD/DEAH box helicase [Ancylobacter rudongensis]|uniref:Superfamily II DNA or RNA helicase n=1 Tax=Ancylobacter rudongensis TaxID=177413 RepID=A0A1G4UPS8_9HYPH|nr:DEAD/DEAH box helicase family protein [Ancylobacter rudongensis]SCW95577.1 Superfamily II DNA or RNA helicase [Ancylobacter rudongensis]